MPPDLICTNPDLLRISGPYGYLPGERALRHYTIFALNEGAGQLTLSQDYNRLLAPVIISPAENHDPLLGNSYYLFYAGQETAQRLHDGDLVTADLRPNAVGQPTTFFLDGNATIPPFPNAETDTNSMGDAENWIRFLTPADKVSGVTFRTNNDFQPIQLTTLADNRDNAFLHIAYRLENGAEVDRPTQPLIELTFTRTGGHEVRLPIGQDYSGTNGALPLADFYRLKGWSTLDIPLSLPVFNPLFEGPNPTLDANTDILRITATDPDGGRIYAETNLDAIFFYRRAFTPTQKVTLSLAPHEDLKQVGDDFIFDSKKETIDLIVSFSPSDASNKQVDWIYDASLAEITQPNPNVPTVTIFRPYVADTVFTIQVRSRDGNLLSNVLSVRIPPITPREIYLNVTDIHPAGSIIDKLNHNDIVTLSVSFDPPYSTDTIIWSLSDNQLQTLGVPAAEFVAVGDNIYASRRHIRTILKGSTITVTAQARNVPNLSKTVTLKTITDDPSEEPQNFQIIPLETARPSYGDTLHFRIDALPAYTTHRTAEWTLSYHPANYSQKLDANVAEIITPGISNGESKAICDIRIKTPVDTTFYIFAQPKKEDGTHYPGITWLPSVAIHTKMYLPTSIRLEDHYKIVSQEDTLHLTAFLSWPSGTPSGNYEELKSPYKWTVEPQGVIQLVDESTYDNHPVVTFTPVRAGVEARIILSLRNDPSIADTCVISIPLTSTITAYSVTHNNVIDASNYTFGDTLTLRTRVEPKEARPAGFEWTFYPSQAIEIIDSFPPFHDSIRIRPLLSQAIIATAHTGGNIRYAASHTLTPVLPAGQSLVIRDAYGRQQAEVSVGDEISLTADLAPNHPLLWEILTVDGTPSDAAVFVDNFDKAHTRTIHADTANETVYIVATATDVPDAFRGIFRLVTKRTPIKSLKIGRPEKPAADSSHVLYRNTVQLQAFVTPSLIDPHPLVWSISPKNIAEFIGEQDDDPFNYTRTVYATSPNDSCIVTVQTADGSFIAHHAVVIPPIPFDSVSLINSLTNQSFLSFVKEVGDTVFLNVEPFPANGSCSTVRWTLRPLGVARFVKTTTSSPLECAVKMLKPNSNVTVELAVDNLAPVTHAISFASIQNVTLRRINGGSLRAATVTGSVIVLQASAQPPEANLAGLQWSIEPSTAATFIAGLEENASTRTLKINDIKGLESFVRVRDPQTGFSDKFPLHSPTTLVSSITLQAEATDISYGTAVSLHAKVFPKEANQSIVWTARNLKTHQSCPIIAYPDGGSPDAILGIAEPGQQILVTATAADGSDRIASILITSKPVSLDSLKLIAIDKNGIPQGGSTMNVHSGDTVFIKADVYPAPAAPNGLFWNIDPIHSARFLEVVPVGTPYIGTTRKVEILSTGEEEVHISVVHPTEQAGSNVHFTLNVTKPEEPIEPEESEEGAPVTHILLLDEDEGQEIEVQRGTNITLTAVIYPKNVIVQNAKWTISPTSAVEWTASSPTSLTRSFTALTPDTTVTITVTTVDGEPKSATYTLHILPLPVTSISLQNITPNNEESFAPGSSVTIQATILPIDATDRRLQWTVSPIGVAEYDAAATASAFVLTPLFHDTTLVITATSCDGSVRTASLSFTTSSAPAPPPPTSIPTSITNAHPSVDYHNGYLQLLNLDGYLCRLTTLTGHTLALFQSLSPNYLHLYPLPSGIYLLSVQKESVTLTFKFLVE
jgi:hypothetical protein